MDFFNGCSLFKLKKQIGWEVKECQTFTIKNNWRSQKFDFVGNNIWINALASKKKKEQGIFGEMFILSSLSSAVFRLQNSVSDFF